MKRYDSILILVFTIANSFYSVMAWGQDKGMGKIGILVAMEKEYNLLSDIAKDDQVVIKLCGIGKVNAAMACVEMIRDLKPNVIVSIGCAGGNGEDIYVGDVVVSTETAFHDVYCGKDVVFGQVQGMPQRYVTPKWLIDIASKLDGRVRAGLVLTGDWFVDSKEKMWEIVSHFPDAIAIDMESAAIAQVCYRYNVKFVSLRIISDIPLADEHGSLYDGFWKTVSAKTTCIIKDYVKLLSPALP